MEIRRTSPQFLMKSESKGLWNKSWVRPFESLWSIVNNYKAVNVVKEHSAALNALGFQTKIIVSTDYMPNYGIYCNLSRTKNDINSIISHLVPDWYIKQIETWTSKPGISAFISEMITYCPQCMKNGYHSILHQLKGIRNCPFHPNVYMMPYLKQRYILGKQSGYIGANNNMFRSGVFRSRTFSYRNIDFEDVSVIPLPTDWKVMPELESFFQTQGLRTDFDYIQPIGATINDTDMTPAIGNFFLKSKTTLKPDIIIYNIDESDKLAINKTIERAEKCGIHQKNIDNFKYKHHFKYIFLQVIVSEMLVQFSDDEIEYKCYQIETGKFISCKDELGKRLLYLLFLIGDEKVEECVQNILKTRDITAQYGIGYQYIPSDICVHALNINNLCISAQYYLLDEFVRMNWKNFQKYIYRIGGITKPSNHSDLILHPIHLIYEKKDTTVYIYRCE